MVEWLRDNPTVLALVRVLVFVVPILLLVPGFIWWERRLLSWMQDRIGPNRTGTFTIRGRKIRTFGLLQPIADGVKLFLKEDVTPNTVDRVLYFLAPMVALFPAFALGGTLPFAPWLHESPGEAGMWAMWTPIANVDIGILYVMAISSLGVYGVVLAGYASNNKYSLLGGLRSSAQLISYELAMGVSLAAIVMASGSLKMTEMVRTQESALWGAFPWIQNWFLFTPFGLVAGLIFLICMVAETNRAPFDLPEAENEIIAGYHTEYSSMKFAVFFMGEYAAMFVFGGVFATVFLGGYNLLPVNWAACAESIPSMAGFFDFMGKLNYYGAPAWFLLKCFAGITFYIWLRATLPRLRYDQLMSLGWKTLLPLAVANFIVVAIWIMGNAAYPPFGGLVAAGAAAILVVLLYLNLMALQKKGTTSLEKRQVALVDPAPARRSVTMVEPGRRS
ncbi:MAG TPA: NADH-quinone oxidoreductase subunit H [Fimbriimonadaceae bacterium]|nr:NADH-quinone oxidoreductase subunit H [Fimbriimonadaceae bacterium]